MKVTRNYKIGIGGGENPDPPTNPTGDIITIRLNVSSITTPNIALAPFKYNKKMAFQVSFDDALLNQYKHMFPLFVGGVSGVDGQTYQGLKYTDGTGKMIPFHATMVVPAGAVRAVSGESGAISYSREHLQQMVDADFGINNHSYYHGGSPTVWDRYDDVRKADQDFWDHYHYRTMIGTTPASEEGFQYTFKNLGYWCHNSTFNEGANDITFYGGWISAQDVPMIFCVYDRQSFGDGFTTSEVNSMKSYFDEIYNASVVEGGRYCGNFLTHGPGNIDGFNQVYQYMHSKGGADLWVPSCQEFFEYFRVKNKTVVNRVINPGNQLTIVLNQEQVESSVRDRGMSFLLTGCTIQNVVSVEGADQVTFNSATGLVNIYKKDTTKAISPASSPQPARITALTASGNSVNITYDKAVTQSVVAAYQISGKTPVSVTGSGSSWSVLFNSAVAGSAMTYRSNVGNAVTVANSVKVSDYINYPIA